jgi:hypothetical protein
MNLINWNSLISNTIWILALAWLLAVLSMSIWSARENDRKLSTELDRPNRQMQLNLGGMLFSVGLALVSEQLWQMLILIALGVLFLVQLVLAARSMQQ